MGNWLDGPGSPLTCPPARGLDRETTVKTNSIGLTEPQCSCNFPAIFLQFLELTLCDGNPPGVLQQELQQLPQFEWIGDSAIDFEVLPTLYPPGPTNTSDCIALGPN